MARRRSHFRSARISGPSTSSSTMPARVPRAALRSPTMPDDSLASRDLADGLSGGAAPSVSARPPLPPTLILASGSVQRRYIMASNQLRFLVEGSYVDEDQIQAYAFNAGLAVVSTTLMIARAKTAPIAPRFHKAVFRAANPHNPV